MGRWLAIDYGVRRIGLAISDPGAKIATPLKTIAAAGAPAADAKAIRAVCEAEEVRELVVGMPINMDGSIGPQAKLTQVFITELRNSAPHLVVEAWDERLSSFQADAWMQEAQLPKSRRKEARDQLAALAILQSFLAARESG